MRAKAQNAIGFGPYSQVNVAGSLIETEPAQVEGLDFDKVTSTVTTIDLSWSALEGFPQTGGSEILSYKISYTA